MERTTVLNKARRWWMVVACAPLVLLAGCPQKQAGAPGRMPANATAPTIGNAGSAKAAQAAQSAAAPAQPAENAATAAARAVKVQQLIGKAEATYHAGVDSYNAGHLEAARMSFDAAVDLMLTSGMDLKSDPQLSDEFEHLLNAVN